jgi:hypothetical protein
MLTPRTVRTLFIMIWFFIVLIFRAVQGLWFLLSHGCKKLRKIVVYIWQKLRRLAA